MKNLLLNLLSFFQGRHVCTTKLFSLVVNRSHFSLKRNHCFEIFSKEFPFKKIHLTSIFFIPVSFLFSVNFTSFLFFWQTIYRFCCGLHLVFYTKTITLSLKVERYTNCFFSVFALKTKWMIMEIFSNK